MRVQKAENVNKALEFITSRGIKLTNIGPEGNSWCFFSSFPAFHGPQISLMVASSLSSE
jgi:hypothetical protein